MANMLKFITGFTGVAKCQLDGIDWKLKFRWVRDRFPGVSRKACGSAFRQDTSDLGMNT
jgi:hypothetical protein